MKLEQLIDKYLINEVMLGADNIRTVAGKNISNINKSLDELGKLGKYIEKNGGDKVTIYNKIFLNIKDIEYKIEEIRKTIMELKEL